MSIPVSYSNHREPQPLTEVKLPEKDHARNLAIAGGGCRCSCYSILLASYSSHYILCNSFSPLYFIND